MKFTEISQPMNIAVVDTGGGNGTGEQDQAVAEAGIAVSEIARTRTGIK
jgi:hypothetical protein